MDRHNLTGPAILTLGVVALLGAREPWMVLGATVVCAVGLVRIALDFWAGKPPEAEGVVDDGGGSADAEGTA